MTEHVEQAVRILRGGGLVAFPTETVYGLGADATNAAAIRRVFDIKGRPATNPLIVHVADETVAQRYARPWPLPASRLATRFWPGPLTLVVPKDPSIVSEVTAGLDTVGLRSPNHLLTLELLRAFDGPLAGPSANRSSHVSPTTAQHVQDEFGDEIDLILDGGPCTVGIESTVLDLTHDPPAIVRPGAVTREQIEAVIGPVQMKRLIIEPTTPATAPGQHERHYAPRTTTFRFEKSQRGLILPESDGKPNGIVALSPLRGFKNWERIIAMPNDPAEYAQRLYAVLRELDAMNLHTIYIEIPPDRPEWAAIRDRIIRASRLLPAI